MVNPHRTPGDLGPGPAPVRKRLTKNGRRFFVYWAAAFIGWTSVGIPVGLVAGARHSWVGCFGCFGLLFIVSIMDISSKGFDFKSMWEPDK